MIEYRKYDQEDLRNLLGILDSLPHNLCKHIAIACEIALGQKENEVAEVFFNTVMHSYATTRNELWLLFHEPIDYVPLYINDPSPAVRHIAKWRLKIAK